MRAGLKSSLIMAQESSMSRSGALASDWYLLGRVRPLEEIAQALDALTPEDVSACAASLASNLTELLHARLVALSEEFGETIDLSILSGGSAVFIDQVPGRHRLVALSAVGQRFPLNCTANGKAMLACYPQKEAAVLIDKSVAAHPDHSLADRAKLLKEIAKARRSHLAFDRGEHDPGIGAVGVAGERGDTCRVLQEIGQRQRIFLVGAAAAIAAHGDGELATREDRDAPALGAGLEREPRMIGRDLARFAFEIGAEIDDLEAGLSGAGDRGIE